MCGARSRSTLTHSHHHHQTTNTHKKSFAELLVSRFPAQLAVTGFLFVTGVTLGAFLGYALYLTSAGLTTYEAAKRRRLETARRKVDAAAYSSGGDGGGEPLRNAYDRGFVRNWLEVLAPDAFLRAAAAANGGAAAAAAIGEGGVSSPVAAALRRRRAA